MLELLLSVTMAAAAMPAPAAAPAPPAAPILHIRLESSTPAQGDTVDVAPPALRLRFSGYIERSYTSLAVTAPDGTPVAIGSIEWIGDDSREFAAGIPPVTAPGPYTVAWRTAGADGHILTGEIVWFLRADTTAPLSATYEQGQLADSGVAAQAPIPAGDAHDHGLAPHDATAPVEVLARLLHFTSLILLLGGFGLRAAVVPRLGGAASTPGVWDAASFRRELSRLAWRGAAAGALLLGVAAVLRLYLQSAAMHGPERALSVPLLSIMLSDTVWGRGWLLQVVGFAVFGAAVSMARPGGDRMALFAAAPGAVLLAMIPSLTGHAAGAGDGWVAVVANDTLHVLAAGMWIGGLMLIMYAIVPSFRRQPRHVEAQAALVDAFSPVALGCAAVVLATGVFNTAIHLGSVSDLWTTGYGRVLLAKLAMVAGVLAAGYVNWRVVRPRLARGEGHRLPLVAGTEVLFAMLTLFVTAVLTGVPRP